jgi:hypothetical protein
MTLTTEPVVIWMAVDGLERFVAFLSPSGELQIERQGWDVDGWWSVADLDLAIDQAQGILIAIQTYLQQFADLMPMEGMA